jgi:hypothetical protein
MVLDRRPSAQRCGLAIGALALAVSILLSACSDGSAPQPQPPAEPGVFVHTLGQMQTARVAFAAAAFDKDHVLLAGGQDANAKTIATVEIYDAKRRTFVATAAPMTAPRFRPSVTALDGGRVLIAGGRSVNDTVLASAEVYDPKSGALEPTANAMSEPRAAHVAVRLDDGTVLLAGGFSNAGEITSADVFDPRSNRFRPAAGQMTNPRSFAGAVRLDDGSVLIAGGDSQTGPLLSAETYDPRSGTFAATAPMSFLRQAPTIDLLDGGKVLIAGGAGVPPPGQFDPVVTDSAEIYDPTTRSFAIAGNAMSTPRMLAFSARLSDGRVLVCGGFGRFFGNSQASCDAFDPRAATFGTAPPLNIDRGDGAAVVLDGAPLFLGGTESGADALGSGEQADAAGGGFTMTGGMSTARRSHAAATLSDGRVLITGGFSGDEKLLRSAEIYDPKDDLVHPLAPMSVVRAYHAILPLRDGTALVAGGSLEPIAEIFDPRNDSLRDTKGAMTTVRVGLAAAVLHDGRVLLAGGAEQSGAILASAEIYDPASESFAATGAMSVPRQLATATLLGDGRVLITGGTPDGNFDSAFASAELYDPATGSFTALSSEMSDPRMLHTATPLDDGRVLIAGGANAPTDDPTNVRPLASLDLFDPATGRFSPSTAPLTVGRYAHTATAVAGGLVLIAGGTTTQLSTASAEVFDPATGVPTATGAMNDGRDSHTATPVELPGGGQFVLVVGGNAEIPPNENGTLASTERWAVP